MRITKLEKPDLDPAALKACTIGRLARYCQRDWANVNYAATPYLGAMAQLDSIDDDYWLDSGREVVQRFLINASSWRGDVARAVKKELNRRLK